MPLTGLGLSLRPASCCDAFAADLTAGAIWVMTAVRLVTLESSRLISSRSDKAAPPGKPRRVYVVTGEGRRKVGIGDVEPAT